MRSGMKNSYWLFAFLFIMSGCSYNISGNFTIIPNRILDVYNIFFTKDSLFQANLYGGEEPHVSIGKWSIIRGKYIVV